MHYFYDTPELEELYLSESSYQSSYSIIINFRHTHGDSRVICYYINPEWREEWYGETIFYKDNGQDDRVISYQPNRAVIFDGNHPHSIRPASFIAPSYRFTLSCFSIRKTKIVLDFCFSFCYNIFMSKRWTDKEREYLNDITMSCTSKISSN